MKMHGHDSRCKVTCRCAWLETLCRFAGFFTNPSVAGQSLATAPAPRTAAALHSWRSSCCCDCMHCRFTQTSSSPSSHPTAIPVVPMVARPRLSTLRGTRSRCLHPHDASRGFAVVFPFGHADQWGHMRRGRNVMVGHYQEIPVVKAVVVVKMSLRARRP